MSDVNKKPESNKLLKQWGIFIEAVLHPIAIVSFLAATIALVSANFDKIDKSTSVLLQIIASILTGVWGGFMWDTFKESSQNSILFKKGQSAVRSLGLSRGKVRNLIGRSRESASKDEVVNLLSLLEKDIANATQEWHDIVPGIQEVEGIYSVLSESEEAVNNLNLQIQQLNQRLVNNQALNANEKHELEKKLKDKESQVLKLSLQINELKSQKDLLSLATTTGTTPTSKTDLTGPLSKFSIQKMLCKKCNKEISSLDYILYDNHCSGCWIPPWLGLNQ